MTPDPAGSALDAGNAVFQEAYRGARDGAGREVPILVVLPDEFALHQQNHRRGMRFSRPSFAQAKSAAHIAVALFTLMDAQLAEEQRQARVAGLIEHIATALDVPRSSGSDAVGAEVTALLELCLRFATLSRKRSPSARLAIEFASDAGPRILRLTELATSEQLTALHEAAEAIWRTLSPAEQAELQVVVVGDHQARARSLGMQYFKRRLKEDPGTDQRVTYGENIGDEQEAIALVATRRLDQRIAKAFFGDENRLQRDVLGDAAMRCLEQMQL